VLEFVVQIKSFALG